MAGVILLTLVALALRLWRLQFQSLWWDEGVSIFLAGSGVRALTVAKDFSVDLHPPGYHLALAGWRVFFGPSVFSDRLFSVFGGTLTIPLTFQFVRQIVRTFQVRPHPNHPSSSVSPSPAPLERGRGGEAAILAAILAAISPIDVYYSQETRMYALLPAIGLISLIATVRVLRTGKRPDWLLWIVVSAVGLYVYYYLGLLTAAEALVLLGSAVRHRSFRWWLLAQVATLALYLPWALLMVRRLGGTALALPAATAVHLTPTSYLLENWQDFTVGFTPPPLAVGLMALFAAATLAGAIVLGRRNPMLLALLLLSALVPLAGAGAVLLARPFFYPRFILFAVVPIWSLAAVGLTAHRRLWPLSALLVVVIVAGNGWTWYHERTTPRVGYAPDDYRTVFQTLGARAHPGDLVLCGYPWQAGYVEAYLWNRGLRTAFLPGRVDADTVYRLVGPSGRAWVYGYSPDHRFEGDWLEETLGTRDQTLVVDEYGDSRVRLFAPKTAVADSSPTPEASLGDDVALLASQVESPPTLLPGGSIRVTLRWRALAVPKDGYKVFLHMLGPDGKVAAQHDGPPLNGAFPTDHWNPGEELVDRYTLTVPAQAKPGRYEIELGMYLPTNGQRLVVGPTPQQDNRIVIGALSVGE